jgi:hypothetical protein
MTETTTPWSITVSDDNYSHPSFDTPRLSEADRRIADYIAEHAAQKFMERVLHAATSEEISDRVLSTWGGKIDRIIGAGLRRLGGFILIALIGIGAVKLGFTEKLINFLKP